MLSVCTTAVLANENANNSVYIELGGNGALYSLNYEKNFDAVWGLRVGLAAVTSRHHLGLGIPMLVNKYWGNESSAHKFETGIGATYFSYGRTSSIFSHDHSDYIAPTASVGYRYLPITKGMTYKVAFTPLVIGNAFIPWVGFSVGTTF